MAEGNSENARLLDRRLTFLVMIQTNTQLGTGKTAQQLKRLVTNPDDLSSIPRTYLLESKN